MENVSISTTENKITNNEPCIAYSYFCKQMYKAFIDGNIELSKYEKDFIKFNSAGIHILSMFVPFFVLGEGILNKRDLFSLQEIEKYNIIRNSIIHHNIILDIDNSKKNILIHFIDIYKEQRKELVLSYDDCLGLYNEFSSKLLLKNDNVELTKQ